MPPPNDAVPSTADKAVGDDLVEVAKRSRESRDVIHETIRDEERIKGGAVMAAVKDSPLLERAYLEFDVAWSEVSKDLPPGTDRQQRKAALRALLPEMLAMVRSTPHDATTDLEPAISHRLHELACVKASDLIADADRVVALEVQVLLEAIDATLSWGVERGVICAMPVEPEMFG